MAPVPHKPNRPDPRARSLVRSRALADPQRTATTALAVRERGYTKASYGVGFFGLEDLEQTAQLRWPLSLNAVESPITRTTWRVDGAGCDPAVVAHVASDLNLPVVGQDPAEVPAVRTRGRFSWSRHLPLALRCLKYGHSYFEQVYRIDEGDGLAHLRKLGYRPPRTISRFQVAPDGGLQWIEQWSGAGAAQNVKLDISRLVAYVLEGGDDGNWIGVSLLRPAYKNWLLKDRDLRTGSQANDRQGMGIPVYTGADGENDLTAGQEIASDMRAGDDAGAAIPFGAELKLMGVEGTLPAILEWVKYHDEQIARAVLAHFLNLGTQTGSWALGTTFADFFTLSLQSIAELVRSTATAHLVEDLVDLNYGPTEPAPRLVFDEIGSNDAAVVQAIATLVQANVLGPDPELEQYIRTRLGLPGARTPAPVPTAQGVPA
jgi:hypothetical protein